MSSTLSGNSLATTDITVSGTTTTANLTATGTTTLAGATTSADINFGDNDKAIFGAGSDLQIYHDGNSWVADKGTGDLYVSTNGHSLYLYDQANAKTMAQFVAGGASRLHYDNAIKLSTTSTGIDVTGTATMDGLNVQSTSPSGSIASFKGSTAFGITLSASADSPYIQSVGVGGGEELAITSGGVKVALFQDGGDISFYEDTGTTAKFFWDASAESLGIGTSSPNAKADLVGGDVTGGLKISQDTTTSAFFSFGADANETRITSSSYGGYKPLTVHTGGTERMRIDSSGNLLVGKNSVNDNVVGQEFLTTTTRLTSDGTGSLYLNRKTSDGDIAVFRKDGTTVGSIGAYASRLYIGDTDTAVWFDDSANAIRPFNTSTVTLNDGIIDLGASSTRFKDLYLSGGVYLGGTGSANHLDDYEEGSFTPAVTNGTSNYAYGSYIKVGDVVTVWGFLSLSSRVSDTTTQYITGLPFTVADTAAGTGWSSSGMVEWTSLTNSVIAIPAWMNDGTTTIGLYKRTAAESSGWGYPLLGSDLSNSTAFRFTATYKAA